jgi:uncharacterized protein
MEYPVVCLVALVASALALFSGFGLGTVLLPAFALFFPPAVAVGLTALVHLAGNLFKLVLMGRHADRGVALRFGVPAVAAAFLGAWLLGRLSGFEPLAVYQLGDHGFSITPVKIVVALLMAAFALEPVLPSLERLRIGRRHLPLGGALSGFLGGLSGHQGALRSVFLLKCGLDKEAFVGTGVVIACAVDLARLGTYAGALLTTGPGPAGAIGGAWPLLTAACLSAFAGAVIGKRLLGKVTIRTVQRIVAVMMLLIAIALGAGLI